MWFIKNLEVMDCLTCWPYSGDDVYRPWWNPCSDESTFTDDEGKEVTSLLDDLAEAKRSTDDTDNDPDTDCVSLWGDVFDEPWTTKDSNRGPTLAELNGGELTDLEQYEPLVIARKRKASRRCVTYSLLPNDGRVLTPVKTCDVTATDSAFKTIEQTGGAASRYADAKVGLQYDEQSSVSLEELHNMNGADCLSKHNRKHEQSGCLIAPDTELKSTSSFHKVKADSSDACSSTSSHSKHPQELDVSRSDCDTSVQKEMKTDQGGNNKYIIHLYRLGLGFK